MTMQWAKLGAVSGLLAAILAAVGHVMLQGLPLSSESLQLLYAYFPAHRTGIQVSALLELWAGLLFLPFVWYLWCRLRSTGMLTAVLALLTGGMLVTVLWIQAALMLALVNLSGASDGGIRVMYTLSLSLNTVALAAGGLFLAAVAASIVGVDALPRWLGWSAGIVAALLLIVGSIAVFSPSLSQSLAEVILSLLFLLWIAAASVVLTPGVWSSESLPAAEPVRG